MFKKVLITEDLDTICQSVENALQQLSIPEIYQSKYCDDAYLKIKKALIDDCPFELLITDLSFKDNYLKNNITTGEKLIDAVKKIQPNLKIIVFSIEDKLYRIKSLFQYYGISSYIIKGRDSIPKLKSTILEVYSNTKPIINDEIALLLKDQQLIEIEDYDISILKLMANGYTLDDISIYLKESSILPNSCSTIEKKITKLKIYFRANNNVQLIAITKDLGLI